MNNRPLQLVALLLAFLFTLPAPSLVAVAQEKSSDSSQEKPKTESSEERKLRKEQENLAKKEEQRKKEEAKARANEINSYRALNRFAEELYAGDKDFRDTVDDEYLNLQAAHARQAYAINVSRRKELLLTENEGEVLQLRRALYENPRVQEYVNRLGQQIIPDDSEKLYAFKVVVSSIPYAYTLSTGTILISTGMVSLLDNEAQLAYVLAHELAHVHKDHWRLKVMLPLAQNEYNRRQQAKRDFWLPILGAMAAGVGQAVAGDAGARFAYMQTSEAVSNYYSKSIGLDWNEVQEDEADEFALKATLDKSFDIKEVLRLYATMSQVASRDSRTQLGFLGVRSRIKQRSDYAQKLIAGSLQSQYQEALKANRLKGMSAEFNVIMSELKRDNGIEAFYLDMFQLARMNLQQAVMLRSDDPLAAYYYGRVLKQVGRTKEDLDLAQQSLLKAVALDVRHDIPEVQLHRALMLMDSKDNGNQAEAINALKSYITAYERKRALVISHEGLLPPNVDVLYGYMRLLGEKTWAAPSIAELQRTTSGSPTTTAAETQLPSIPRIDSPSQTLSPTPGKRGRKP